MYFLPAELLSTEDSRYFRGIGEVHLAQVGGPQVMKFCLKYHKIIALLDLT